MALTLKQALALFWEQIQVQFVKRENGKGLSTNDFTTEEKNKLASLKNTTIDTTLTISNAAADAKTVGDALAEKQPVGDYALKSEILPADWNENDPNSSAYIENRTHYTEIEMSTILEETVLTEYIPNIPAYYFPSQQELGQPVIGETYTVFYNGTKYECQCFSIYNDTFMIGNGRAYLGPISEAPFLIYGFSSNDWSVESYDLATSVTLSVSGNGVNLEETTLTEYEDGTDIGVPSYIFFSDKEITEMVVGETYTVLYNGTKYECQCFSSDDGGMCLGNDVTNNISASNEPFLFCAYGAHEWCILAYDFPTSVTLSISGNMKIIHKLDSEYLLNSNIENAGDTGIRLKNEEWMGDNDYTPGKYSVALGFNVKASGHAAYAEGGSTSASGPHSHAEGRSTSAEAQDAHAEGWGTVAKGWTSHAEGEWTIATGRAQHVEGIYNVADSYDDGGRVAGKYLHITGNGTERDGRSNAYALDWNGNAYYAGDVYVAGDGKNDFAGSKKLATEDFVTAALTALGLPVPTAADAGKILRVNAQGKYELVSIANAEEATF